MFKMTEEQIAARFGCTVAQVRANHKANEDVLSAMTKKAKVNGKANGYTADQLTQMTAKARMLSVGQSV